MTLLQKSPLRNERGVALVTVLILAVAGLILTIGMLQLVSRGGFVSGQQKRYRTAVEASKGGVEATFQAIAFRASSSTSVYDCAAVLSGAYFSSGLLNKYDNATVIWANGVNEALAILPGNTATYDVSFTMGGYIVYTKIVDTIVGNSGVNEGLISAGVVSSGTGEIVVQSIPYLYTIEVLTQSATNPNERARMNALYQY